MQFNTCRQTLYSSTVETQDVVRAHTHCLQYRKVLTWQGKLTEEQQYHEQGLWNEHTQPDGSTLKPNRSCAWAEPYQLPPNIFSFDMSSLKACLNAGFEFFSKQKEDVYTLWFPDLYTIHHSAKFFIWSGFWENRFVRVFIWTELHTPVLWRQQKALAHCLTWASSHFSQTIYPICKERREKLLWTTTH